MKEKTRSIILAVLSGLLLVLMGLALDRDKENPEPAAQASQSFIP